jgi:hypothetical protein
MKFSREETFIIPKQQIITMVEVDKDVQTFYAMSLKKLDGNTAPSSGRLSSVEEARNKLEDIFNE